MDARSLAEIAVASSAAGFGASAGRDAYRTVSKNALWYALIAITFFGVAYALFDMTRGHRRGPARFWLRTVLLNAVIVVASLGVSAFSLNLIGIRSASGGFPVPLWLGLQAAGGVAGALIGLAQRRGRLRRFATEERNERFLREAGLRDVGGSEDTWVDGDGTELKLTDLRSDAVVFRVVGRRGVRAFLRMDEAGQFVEYTGPVK